MEKYTHFDFLPVQFRYIINLLGRQWIARAIALTLVVFVAAFIFALISPVAGEPFFYNLSNLSGLLTFTFAFLISCAVCGFAAFVVSFCLSLSVRMAYQDIGETMKRNRDNAPASLDAWNIHPDIPVFQSLDETDTEFERRISNARLKVNDEAWAVVLRFRKIEVKVDDNSAKGMYNTRSGEGSFFPLLTDQQVTTETEQEYNARLNEFCREWQPFAQREKLSRIKGNVFAKTLQTSANILIFCLLSLAAFGQNTAKIHNALQDNDKIVTANNVVNYTFTAGQSATRTADGTKTISELYAAGRAGADGRNIGEVDSISINGVAIPLQKIIIASTGTLQQPATLFADGSVQEIKGIPDSATTANSIHNAEKYIRENGKEIERFTGQWWASKLAEWSLFVITCVIVFFRSLSKSAYAESGMRRNGSAVYNRFVLNIGHYGSGVTFLSMWLAGLVLLPIAFYVLYNYGFWTLFFFWWSIKTVMILIVVGIGELWVWLVGKGVPNPNQADIGGGGNGGGYANNGQKGLNGRN